MSSVLEPGSIKKIKISLDDYPFASDIAHRVALHSACSADIKVLEEILYSSIKTTHKQLLEETGVSIGELNHSLQLFKQAGLLKEEEGLLLVDKELRKYFEVEIRRFEPDFQPGVDFLAQLLKKVPIHSLPTWYALPRTSTHIFDSIIEKYLQTPYIYQRLLNDVQTTEPSFKALMDLLFTSDNLELEFDVVKAHFNLSQEALFEWIALLEFNLVAALKYKPVENRYIAYLSPFAEFRNYLLHLRSTEPQSLVGLEVEKITLSPFAFIDGLFILLKTFKAKSFTYPLSKADVIELKENLSEGNLAYLEFEELLQKLLQLHLIEIKNQMLTLNETSYSLIAMKPESAALVLYRHPLNKPKADLKISVEKAIRECEKAACRLLGKDWVLTEDFYHSLMVPFSDEEHICLKKSGRSWNYSIPTYTAAEKEFIAFIFTDWFEKVGVIETGFFAHKPCLRLSMLGTEIFS